MSDLFSSLDMWVKRQNEVKSLFEKAELDYRDADRLTLITLSRAAFQHMMRTIEAFDQWLKDGLEVGGGPVHPPVQEAMKEAPEKLRVRAPGLGEGA
ncbi:MAG: DUF2153 family protein, partial [Thermosphaera sp.]